MVGSRFTVREQDLFSTFACGFGAKNVVGRGLKTQCVLPCLEVLPFVHAGKLRLIDVKLEPKL